MRTFKNWKSELKKKGAMALTAFMLCGSAGTAFAQSTITIHDGTTGDIVSGGTVSGDKTLGNVKTVTGYQTDIAEGYAAEIDWGDMLFIYDRGTFDPTTGTLVESSVEREIPIIGEDDQPTGETETTLIPYHMYYPRCYDPNMTNSNESGYWYWATDGAGQIVIHNLSTNTIYTKISPVKLQNDKLNNVTLHVYGADVDGDDIGSGESTFTSLEGPDDAEYWTTYYRQWIREDANITASTDYLHCYLGGLTYNSDGSTASEPYYTIAGVNLYGTPAPEFRNETEWANDNHTGEKIGEIVISFNKVTGTDGNYTPGEELQALNGDADVVSD